MSSSIAPAGQIPEQETKRILGFAKQGHLGLLSTALENLKDRLGLTIADLVVRIKDEEKIGPHGTPSHVGIVHLTIMGGHTSVFDYLFGVEGNQSGNSPYGVFTSFARRQLVVNIGSNAGTPLTLAAKHKEITMLRRLLSYGADWMANDRQLSGWIPLHHAANLGDVASTNFLLQRDASYNHINARTLAQETPLLIACRRGMYANVTLLFRLGGADLDKHAQNIRGESAVHIAAYEHNARLVNYLCHNGCPHNLVNVDGQTPFEVALQCLHTWRAEASVLDEFQDVIDEIQSFEMELEMQRM